MSRIQRSGWSKCPDLEDPSSSLVSQMVYTIGSGNIHQYQHPKGDDLTSRGGAWKPLHSIGRGVELLKTARDPFYARLDTCSEGV
jgi:hypothetical protein